MRAPKLSATLIPPSSDVICWLPVGLFGYAAFDVRLATVLPVMPFQNSRRIVPVPPDPWTMKLAAIDVLLSILIVLGWVAPAAPPVQPTKSCPLPGTAVSVTDVPPAYV